MPIRKLEGIFPDEKLPQLEESPVPKRIPRGEWSASG